MGNPACLPLSSFNYSKMSMYPSYESKSGFGGTKRRKFSSTTASSSSLNRRIGALQKKVKAVNPCHLYPQSLGAGTGTFNTTGVILDLVSGIVQGDAFNQRFGNKIIPKRVVLKAVINPGASQTTVCGCRISLVRATYNLAAGPIVGSSLSPISDSNILQVYWDKYFAVGPSPAGQMAPVVLNWNVPIKLSHFKFSGSGAGTTVAESLFLIWSGTNAAGVTAPVWNCGIVEFYYIP